MEVSHSSLKGNPAETPLRTIRIAAFSEIGDCALQTTRMQMNPLIQQIYATRTVEDDDGNRFDIFPAIKYSEGQALYQLIRSRKAARTLEIGMAQGLSSLFMCQAHFDDGAGIHTAVDPRQSSEWRSIGLANVRRAGLEGFFRFIEAGSDAALPDLIAAGEEFDLIFIDGKHLFDFVLVDFYFSDKLIRPGGCVVFHDYWMPAIRKALSFVLANRKYKVISPPSQSRWSPFARFTGFFLSLVQNHSDVFSLRLILAPSGRNYWALEKLADDERVDGHFKRF